MVSFEFVREFYCELLPIWSLRVVPGVQYMTQVWESPTPIMLDITRGPILCLRRALLYTTVPSFE